MILDFDKTPLEATYSSIMSVLKGAVPIVVSLVSCLKAKGLSSNTNDMSVDLDTSLNHFVFPILTTKTNFNFCLYKMDKMSKKK